MPSELSETCKSEATISSRQCTSDNGILEPQGRDPGGSSSGGSGRKDCEAANSVRQERDDASVPSLCRSDSIDPEHAEELSKYFGRLGLSEAGNEADGGDCKVLATFNWNEGGREVHLLFNENGTERKFRMLQNGSNFIFLRYIPRGIYEYSFLVDGKPRHASDQSHRTTDRGTKNFMNSDHFMPIYSIIGTGRRLPDSDTFAQSQPDSKYMNREAVQIPSSLLYRSPIFSSGNRLANDIHIMARHVYQDTQSPTLLGQNYRSYTTIHRWEKKIDDIATTNNSVTIIYITKATEQVENSEEDDVNNWFRVVE
ncbi:hypothetical protein BgAZ_402080 [Babesia gibsoni]|uniref:AMP-activated protein kinase glycogen-binding domain-containing protein n=1 Tax=Babesia gibsoni TaxID=33632 RepID=A0AAD8LMK4_BABGI|nr:hypothetical protein BgAZ_402080 [Babesia gibsoni]